MINYADHKICLTTKHKKEQAIAPVFSRSLGAKVSVCAADTDLLGTFSGEIDRQISPMECVRQKCLWGMQISQAALGLANEGSFGPHPQNPFMPCDIEILYFVDQLHNIELAEKLLSTKTNYRMATVNSWQELCTFASDAQFPTHGLILKPSNWVKGQSLIKGIRTQTDLHQGYQKIREISSDGGVQVETDMRAHHNPQRMLVIQALAEKLVQRLQQFCPQCQMPGWGVIDHQLGLPCEICATPTQLVKAQIFGCVRCDYTAKQPRNDNRSFADPGFCFLCNP